MRVSTPPPLEFEQIDDLLYLTRANESQELDTSIQQLAEQYQCRRKDILEAAIDPETGNTVLHFCSANGLSELLSSILSQLKIEEGADQTGFSPLINHGNKEGNTPLHWAAYNGHLPVVKTLLGVGADMWLKNAAGHLAMFEAERADKNDVVQHLLEAGGKEVEKAGVEGQASAEDVEDVAEEEGAEGGFTLRAGTAGQDDDVKMEDVNMEDGKTESTNG
ncbi:unnamed protein product [Zymoseptoria tritici ST99CH_3D1]|uniref:Uncharacterized protein n=3 Tax=Zymoseptoria tritici TaxID=1047171 RepID=F9XHC9_ZYMTI|nr:uncharacterized protein MYCGRDRAFT_105616 [Zymoseptoria tritici IPO323]EGP85190.1 hypothetical protein MYCGRDRAFT_105616 [Zymoseptoria tritici IPO323]SMQ53728.1 unnamed protein product [Zymoseptoria tritici ST99CH_3D7]SMR57301.1 unnamed protein product [Zymoseptoria tritici ST99CH_1E4]SMR60171.1 unnamed protein product [Zymoseptoria tritici ST99CH_3D1]